MNGLLSILTVAILAGAAYAQTPSDCMQSGCGMGGQCVRNNQGQTSMCVCFQGYQVSRQTFRCEDINECRSGMPLCRNGRCHNLIGSYVCECFPGYRRGAPDGRRCVPMPSAQPRQGFMPSMDEIIRCRMVNNMIEM